MEEADSSEWGLLGGHPATPATIRLVEYHTYLEGGHLSMDGFARHHDCGSLLTMVVMLSEPGVDFEGGVLLASCPEMWQKTEKCIELPLLHRGDCAIFPSHKFHNVTAVTKGKRHVAVMELWTGIEGKEDNRAGMQEVPADCIAA
jgi:predicted 2-oxoglutarate/Fe(II)-dependent dioxygenase YbiX